MKVKINWADAPYWAQYWAMDADGSAYWYESCPHYDIYDEVWTPHIKIPMDSNEVLETDCAPADAYGFNPANCKNSKTERPSDYNKVESKESKPYAVNVCWTEGKTSHANARLISAAPELLESLEKLHAILSKGGVWTIEDQKAAYEAIAKAKGEQE